MSKQTELVLQNAANQVNAATVGLQKVMTELAKNVELIDSQNQTIAMNENKIEELTAQYKEKARESEVNFQLSLKENQKNAVEVVLKEQGLTAVKTDEYQGLILELTKMKKELGSEVEKARAEERAKAESAAKVQITELTLKQAADNAQMKAQLESANREKEMYQSQAKSLNEMIVAMREAETERVKAMSGKDVIVNTSNGK